MSPSGQERSSEPSGAQAGPDAIDASPVDLREAIDDRVKRFVRYLDAERSPAPIFCPPMWEMGNG